ncbi:MAG: hypothetical protein P1U53_11145 [Sulfitobacter sp.]|nr:hypothetical protein [Sulfitobacter sp.]
MFQSVLGTDGSEQDLQQTWPKFKHMRHNIRRFVKMVKWLGERQELAGAGFGVELANVKRYAAQLMREEAVFDEVPSLDREGTPADLDFVDTEYLESLPEDTVKRFSETYGKAVTRDRVHPAICTCKNLVPVRSHLTPGKEFSDAFLKSAGHSFEPFPKLPSANFKSFYQSDRCSDSLKYSLLSYLSKLAVITHAVYEAYNRPEIDVQKFAGIVKESLSDIKSVPELNRCDAAFRKIEASMDLMENNFGTYYRDMQISGDRTILMQNFVLDVAKDGKSSPQMTGQFRKIIGFYRKQSKAASESKEMKAVFGALDSNLQELESHSKAAAASGAASAETEAAPEESGAAEGVSKTLSLTPKKRADIRRKVNQATN